MRCASQHLSKRIRNEGAAPKSQVALTADAIHRGHKDAVQRSMRAHGVFPPARRERLISLEFFEPPYSRRIKDNLCAFNGVHPRSFRIPLVITNQGSDDGLARIHPNIAEITWREIMLFIVIRVMRN